jgi:hypothetical protein
MIRMWILLLLCPQGRELRFFQKKPSVMPGMIRGVDSILPSMQKKKSSFHLSLKWIDELEFVKVRNSIFHMYCSRPLYKHGAKD